MQIAMWMEALYKKGEMLAEQQSTSLNCIQHIDNFSRVYNISRDFYGYDALKKKTWTEFYGRNFDGSVTGESSRKIIQT